MAKIDMYNMKGEVVGDIELNDSVFGVEVNEAAMHSVVVNQLANARQGTQSTLTKSEVRGGGKKPWRQKGTGRARQGSIRSAQWTGGGIVFAPKPRSYRYSLPKKMRRVALKSALSSKVANQDMIVLDTIALDAIKTKAVAGMLGNLKVDGTVLIVVPESDTVLTKSARNIPGVKTAHTHTINTYDILKYKKIIMTKDAVSAVEEVYA